MPPFGSVLEQVQAELRWLSLRLRTVVERGRRRREVGPPTEYRGLYIADEEVDQILGQEGTSTLDFGRLVEEAAAVRLILDRRARDTGAAGLDLPLDRIARIFDLRPAERQLLIVGLGPCFDVGYERIYAYANDDIAKKWPTVGLALEIVSDDRHEAVSLRSLFYDEAPLSRFRLVTVADDHATSSLVSRYMELDPHVAEVLLGFDGLDPRLSPIAELTMPSQDDLEPAEPLARVLRRRPDARIYLNGRWCAEKQAEVSRACALLGVKTIVVDTPAFRQAGAANQLFRLVLRDARLMQAALYFEDWEGQVDVDDGQTPPGVLMRRMLEDHPLPVFFSGRSANPEGLPLAMHLHLESPTPGYAERQRHWDETEAGACAGLDTGQLAATFRLGSREIRSATHMARSLAAWRGDGSLSLEDLKTAARLQSQARLTSLAQKIVPNFSWEDIVLPTDRVAQLQEIATQVLYQHVVYDEWGFAAKASLGRGVTTLFAGESGTGKTMAADIIANELGLELYKIDLSGLVSKYIGETEKNLARVFDEAGDTNAILFFDEADAIFGKRTEVRDSHDRYANIEVSYLLQKMEEYDGIVILATNLRSNLDESFLRRMKGIVEFPFPEEEDRLRIWQRTISASAPMADDVDLKFMARQFRIAGGNIKNIVILAAFLAAEEGESIGMAHLIRASRREYQKLGRLITETDFADWYEEVKG